MVRLGQIIVTRFLRPTDADKDGEETRGEEKNKSFQPLKLQRTDCTRGKK